MTRVDSPYDIVHDSQQLYRKLLDSMARPGKINKVQATEGQFTGCEGIRPSMLAIALTLLDRESSFYVRSPLAKAFSQYVKWKTFSKEALLANAQFIFIQDKLSNQDIMKLAQEVNVGTLHDPHEGATIIIDVQSLDTSSNNGTGIRFSLTGPGIKTQRSCVIDGIDIAWFEARERRNAEFPLGFDLILVSTDGAILSIPRTTHIHKERE